MGETGIGKTAVLNYLADVIDADFFTFNVHAGITEN
jgi:MoxR-like ATPase